MTGIQETSEAKQRGYFMPASLVNRLILAIVGAILAIGGYMVLWAMSDVAWKSTQELKINEIAKDMGALSEKHTDGIHPIAAERILAINGVLDDNREFDTDTRRKLDNHLQSEHRK